MKEWHVGPKLLASFIFSATALMRSLFEGKRASRGRESTTQKQDIPVEGICQAKVNSELLRHDAAVTAQVNTSTASKHKKGAPEAPSSCLLNMRVDSLRCLVSVTHDPGPEVIVPFRTATRNMAKCVRFDGGPVRCNPPACPPCPK